MADVVLITGANQGIGLALTRYLLRDGYRVGALDLSTENLLPLTVEHPITLRYFRCDITDPPQVNAAVAALIREWGQIDILVNNAALAVFCPFEQKALQDTRREFEVNYFGALYLIRAVLPHMQARGQGLIHNVSSTVGVTGFPGIYGYVSTKGAIEGLTRTLALECAPYGINVNIMYPPLTRTKSAEPLGIPPQMMADPEEVGRKLARKIRSRKAIVTGDFTTALGVFMSRHFPVMMGRFMARMTARAHREDRAARP